MLSISNTLEVTELCPSILRQKNFARRPPVIEQGILISSRVFVRCRGVHLGTTLWSQYSVFQRASFIDGFAKTKPESRYILSNELGDGRVLIAAPILRCVPHPTLGS